MSDSHATVISDLNDLIQLDYDAIMAYTVAIDTLKNAAYRERLVTYRADHKRHVEELGALVRARGGIPVELPHVTTFPFKLAMQAEAALGGDTAILMAFKSNEGQVRDKYRRYATHSYPPEVGEVVRRAAADEETHYNWVASVLQDLGHGPRSVEGQAVQAVETVTRKVADAVEGVQRAAMKAIDGISGER